jgi:ribosomal protein L12E/L44/L45/RPP1/RPP2
MLTVLSKFGRLHKPAAPAGAASGDARNAAGGAGQALREQKEEMAKDRRDEKLALRRGQGAGGLGTFLALCRALGAL